MTLAMGQLARGGMVARLAQSAEDLAKVQALRVAAFGDGAQHWDAYDQRCQHLLVETLGGAVCASMRLLALPDAPALLQDSYAAQFYDLAALKDLPGPFLELGRFAVAPGPEGWAALRLAWVALTRLVDGIAAEALLGCTSFSGCDWQKHRAGLALLARQALAPQGLRPRPRARHIVDFPGLTAADAPPQAAALSALPPLLRSYLSMGAWVSDHAVEDHQLNTLHVFTYLPIAQIPKARQASLRALETE